VSKAPQWETTWHVQEWKEGHWAEELFFTRGATGSKQKIFNLGKYMDVISISE
jgi:hypothetical protein